jgi:hypothetical protein
VDVYIAVSWERALKENLHLCFILLFLYTVEQQSLAMAQAAAHFTGCLHIHAALEMFICVLPPPIYHCTDTQIHVSIPCAVGMISHHRLILHPLALSCKKALFF